MTDDDIKAQAEVLRDKINYHDQIRHELALELGKLQKECRHKEIVREGGIDGVYDDVTYDYTCTTCGRYMYDGK